MNNDPIVDEVRQTRAKLLDECNGDLTKLLERLKDSEAQDRSRIVTADAMRKRRQLQQTQEDKG